ncbi:DsrE family protein [Thalassoglobus sp. JC818]|uniref:DsrE family protein n=1 Tax=Thalassoglobus sp. JC818 TaxID=3232136 RepID=UPI00345A9271
MQSNYSLATYASILCLAILCCIGEVQAQTPVPEKSASASKLAIVWTSSDPEVAHRMVLMYAQAAKKAKWFDEVRLIVWGPSSRLLAADKDLQSKIQELQKDGVILQACVVCADSYGVADRLRELGLEVKGMGKPLTDFIKDPETHVLTF